MPGGSFVDTNIWIYAHLRQAEDQRHPLALDLVSSLKNGVISPRVTAEYYNVMLKAGREDNWIQENLSAILGYVHCQPQDVTVVLRSWEIRNRYGFSIWDSQILAAALVAGCERLYTEDLQHNQQIEGLVVINPFVAPARAEQ